MMKMYERMKLDKEQKYVKQIKAILKEKWQY